MSSGPRTSTIAACSVIGAEVRQARSLLEDKEVKDSKEDKDSKKDNPIIKSSRLRLEVESVIPSILEVDGIFLF